MTVFIRQLVCGGWILFFALPLQAKQTQLFVDPDFSGAGTGAASAPWRALDPSAWLKINTELASGDVTVFFSARAADADVYQTTTAQLQLRRTDTSSNRLTLDGMSRYNANDATPVWFDYTGTSRFTINYGGWDAITGTTNSPYLASYITLRGFRAFSKDGKPINI